MPLSPTQILQQVRTYQPSALGGLANTSALIHIANKEFGNFMSIPQNLGDTVNYQLPYQATANVGLVVTFGSIEQRVHSLTVDQAFHAADLTTAQDRIFTLDKDAFWEKIGKAKILALGAQVEATAALMAHSAIPVMQVVNGQSVPTGALHTESGPINFYGDGLTAINSFTQLVQMCTNFKEPGFADSIKVVLPTTVIPNIIQTGFSQFTLKRGDATSQSWEIGSWAQADYYSSNLMPIHYSGTIGNQAALADRTLTVVSTNDPTGANITQITCTTTVTTDANAIKSGDLAENYDVVGITPVRRVTEYGKVPTSQPVQIRMVADAASSGGTVIINLATESGVGLCAVAGDKRQNISTNIVAGMKFKVIPSHKCGLLIANDAFMLAMPPLPETIPYPSKSERDEKTGVGMRMYYGEIPFQNQRGLVFDTMCGFSLFPRYSMRICFPLT